MARTEADLLSTAQWWGGRRLRYNLSVVVACAVAFILYAGVVWSFQNRLPDVEITGFTVMAQAIGFLFALALANVCYFLGPMLERLLSPRNLGAFRRGAFGLGLGFSMLLIFCPPTLVAYAVLV